MNGHRYRAFGTGGQFVGGWGHLQLEGAAQRRDVEREMTGGVGRALRQIGERLAFIIGAGGGPG